MEKMEKFEKDGIIVHARVPGGWLRLVDQLSNQIKTELLEHYPSPWPAFLSIQTPDDRPSLAWGLSHHSDASGLADEIERLIEHTEQQAQAVCMTCGGHGEPVIGADQIRILCQGCQSAGRSEEAVSSVVVLPQPAGHVSTRRWDDLGIDHHLIGAALPLVMADRTCLTVARQQVAAEYPWAASAVDTVLGGSRLRLAYGDLSVRIAPLLLVGPPGSGKTRLAQRLGECLGLSVMRVQASGDPKLLEGTARGWGTATPSPVLSWILGSRTANPLIVVDELDKIDPNERRNGNLYDVLLSLLEPDDAARYRDPALQVECDLSHVNWIMTANGLRNIPQPVLSRLRIVEISKPDIRHLPAIIRTIRRDLAAAQGVDASLLPELDPDQKAVLYNQLSQGRQLSLRIVRRMYEHLLGHAVERQVVH